MEKVRGVKRYTFPGNKYLVGLLLCFFAGAVCGCIWAVWSYRNSGLEHYLKDYFALFAQAAMLPSFAVAVFNCMRWLLIAVLLGLSAAGILGIPTLIALRGFLLAYASTYFGLSLGEKGVVIWLLLCACVIIFELPALFLFCCEAMRNSLSCRSALNPERKAGFSLLTLLPGFIFSILSITIQRAVLPGVITAVCIRFYG